MNLSDPSVFLAKTVPEMKGGFPKRIIDDAFFRIHALPVVQAAFNFAMMAMHE